MHKKTASLDIPDHEDLFSLSRNIAIIILLGRFFSLFVL